MKKIINSKNIILLLVWFLFAIAAYILYTGTYNWHIKTQTAQTMLLELFIIFCVSYSIIKFVKSKTNLLLLLSVEVLIFSYLHMMLFPVIANVIYMAIIFSVGCCCLQLFHYNSRFFSWECFGVGISFIIILEYVLSIFHIGSTKNFLIAVLFIGCTSIIFNFRKGKEHFFDEDTFAIITSKNAILISIFIVIVCIFIGRCNLSLDYDGYWYALRPDILLNSGNGIFDNTYAVSNPNTYPKGYEILILPLSIFPSYSFMLTFNIAIGVLAVIAVYNVLKQLKCKYPLLSTALMACIPGIMNMATTVKQDNITLLCQIIMLYFAIKFLKDYLFEHLANVFSFYVLSLNMKTTAIVFSSAIMLVVFCYGIKHRHQISLKKRDFVLPIISGTVFILLCIRTYLICGYPYTSLLNPLWNLLGFEIKFPYVVTNPTESLGIKTLLTKGGLLAAIKKWSFVFIEPINFSDVSIDHIIMTWGTPLTFLELIYIVWVVLCRKKKSLKEETKMLLWVYGALLILSSYSIATLIKNDGNYYMVFYVVSIITASVLMFGNYETDIKYIKVLITPIFIFCILLTSISNWAWSLGFSKVEIINKGFYNHKEAFEKFMTDNKKDIVYDYYKYNDTKHVLGFGSIETVDSLPCLVESAVEIFAYGGASYMSSFQDFTTFLEAARIDNIYVDDSFNDSSQAKYLQELIDEGYVKDIISQNKNFILVLNTDSENVICSEDDAENFRNAFSQEN